MCFHKDLHARNVLFTAPDVAAMSEELVMSRLGPPRTAQITRTDGLPCEPSMPSYLVTPVSIRDNSTKIKIVDLGNGIAQIHIKVLFYV